MRNCVAAGLALMTILACQPAPTKAQDSVLAELYGSGVHHYFAGAHVEAHGCLTTAIEQGTLDPRAYFFRGLANSMLGRPYEAQADFTKGAQLEVSGADRVYPVGSSLQRVQGAARQMIEKARQQARIAARARGSSVTRPRSQDLDEGRVLRGTDRAAPAPATDLLGRPPTQDANDPFAAPPSQPVPAPVSPAPPAATPPATEDPFGTPPAADPFSTPAAPMPEVAPGADPFGTPADPFGTPPATTPPPPTPDAAVDPFADDPAAPAAPASPPADPFN